MGLALTTGPWLLASASENGIAADSSSTRDGEATPTAADAGGEASEPTTAPPAPAPEPDSAPTGTPDDDGGAQSPTPSQESIPSGRATPQQEAGDVVVQTVPQPNTTQAIVSVKVGGERSSATSVAPLSGVRLQLYSGNSAPTSPRTEAWAICTSDADGDCNFTVPNTNNGGANRNAQFWVVQIPSAPASPAANSYFTNPSLVTGIALSGYQSTNYVFRTPQLTGGNTYTTTPPGASFMYGTGQGSTAARTASGGIWQNSRNNPAAIQKCGLNIALVLDLSGSVNSNGLPALKSAAKDFVDSLTGTPSAVSLFTFASTAPKGAGPSGQNYPTLQSLSLPSDAATVKDHIDDYTASGATNWDRGLYQVAQNSQHFDIAIVITDGNPTVYGGGSQQAGEGNGSDTRFREVENSIFSANALKAKGTRVLSFGVGSGTAGGADNLRAVSGPVAGSDYFQTNDYAGVGDQLAALAAANCDGTITVIKQVVPSTTPTGSTTGAQLAGGWNFTATDGPGTTITPDPASGVTGDTGAVNFDVDFGSGSSSAPVTVTEHPTPGQSGYTLHQAVAGQNAVCQTVGTGNPVPIQNAAGGFTVTATANAAISCVVYNRAPAPQASVQVTKQWVINGVTYANGDQPGDFQAQLTVNGSNQAWNAPRTGLTAGDSVAIAENTTISGLPLCRLASSRVTEVDGVDANLGLPHNPTLHQGANTFEITNTITCESKLTLVKNVQGGNANPTSWTLKSIVSPTNNPAPANPLPGPNGTTGTPAATALVTPGIRYELAESGGDPHYKQYLAPGAVIRNGSTGTWDCVEINPDNGQVIPGFADGLNGGVRVPMGLQVRCTATNQTAQLTLLKHVVNDSGGTASADAWDLHATPTGDVPDGLDPVTVDGAESPSANNTVNVRPGQGYSLSETGGPSGYASVLECDTGDNNAWEPAESVAVAAADHVTCRFTNNDQPAHLTLVKVVDRNGTTDTTPATAWTLTAKDSADATVATGATGTPAVTNVAVPAGSYQLSESDIAGYHSAGWQCSAGLGGDHKTVTIGLGRSVTCTVLNVANRPDVTVHKQVFKDGVAWDGQQVHPGEHLTWVITATNTADNSVPFTGPLFTDDLSQILAGTDLVLDPGRFTTTGPVNVTFGPSSVNGATSGPLAAGADVTITFSATVKARADLAAAGITTIDNTVVPGQNVTCTTGDPDCTTTNPLTPNVTITKTVTRDGQDVDGQSVKPGDELTWTITVTNPADVAYTGPLFTDDLTQILAGTDLTWPDDVSSDSSQVALSFASPTLTAVTADGQSLGGGETVHVTYTATVRSNAELAKAGLTAIHNVVVPSGDVLCPAQGSQGPDCETDNPLTPAWKVVKTSDPASGSTVNPGATITYTLTAANLTAVPATGIVVSDDLTGLLDHIANPGSAPTIAVGSPSAGTAARQGDALVWHIDSLPAGGATLTYSVVVADDAWDLTLHNVITGSGDVPPQTCPAPSDDAAQVAAECSTEHHTPRQPTLQTEKMLVDEFNGPATKTSWDLHANGPSGDLSGAGGFAAQGVNPGTYTLSETPVAGFDPAGYTASAWQCRTSPDGQFQTVEGNQVTVAIGDQVLCRITNTAQPPLLTLQKLVQGPNGTTPIGPATPKDWILSAEHTGGIGGASGHGDVAAPGSVVNHEINAGTYVLGEAPAEGFDPTGFETGNWLCLIQGQDGNKVQIVDGKSQFTIGLGQNMHCSLTNVSVPPAWTITKTADPASGSQVQVGEEITYTVTATHTAGVPLPHAVITDDLSDVVPDKARLTSTTFSPSVGSAALEADGTTVTWTIDNFTGTASLQYTVKVADDAWGKTMHNSVSGEGTGSGPIPPAQCTTEAPCTTTHTVPALPTLELTKVVQTDHGTAGVPADWNLIAQPGDGDIGAPGNPGQPVAGRGGFEPKALLPGQYTLSEEPREGFDDRAWTPGLWQCVSGEGEPVVLDDGQLNLAAGQAVSCTIVNADVGVDLAIDKSHSDIPEGGVIDTGDTFSYTLAVQNVGENAAHDVHVSDPIPSHVKVDESSIVLPAGWTHQLTGTDSQGYGGTLTLDFAGPFAPLATVDVTFEVTLKAGSTSDTVNSACVASLEGDTDTSNNCDDDTIPTKQILPGALVQCAKDVPWLNYDIATKNVPNADTLPVTVTWRLTDGTVVRTDTIPAGQLKGRLLWPGAQVRDSDGAGIAWPGWRVVREGETPQFENQIADPSLESYKWRGQMLVTFEINPSAVVSVVYPPTSPGCEIPRNPGVQIDKVASTSTVLPGGDFSYTLKVKNTDLGAANTVVVDDEINSALKVNAVRTAQTGFPRWSTCAVTGADSAGYGGHLHCALNGVLGYNQAAPDIALDVTLHPGAQGGQVPNTGRVCWNDADRPGVGTVCNSDTVIVQVPGGPGTENTTFGGPTLPRTGGGIGLGVILAVLATLTGALVWRWSDRRRRYGWRG